MTSVDNNSALSPAPSQCPSHQSQSPSTDKMQTLVLASLLCCAAQALTLTEARLQEQFKQWKATHSKVLTSANWCSIWC